MLSVTEVNTGAGTIEVADRLVDRKISSLQSIWTKSYLVISTFAGCNFSNVKKKSLMNFFVIYDYNQRDFGFLGSWLDKETFQRCHFGLWGIAMSVLPPFLTFYRNVVKHLLAAAQVCTHTASAVFLLFVSFVCLLHLFSL